MTGGVRTVAGELPPAVRVLLAIGALALLGAAAFGLWHVVVGGLINGNPRAGMFGLVLAIVASVPLIVGVYAIRRRRSRSA